MRTNARPLRPRRFRGPSRPWLLLADMAAAVASAPRDYLDAASKARTWTGPDHSRQCRHAGATVMCDEGHPRRGEGVQVFGGVGTPATFRGRALQWRELKITQI